MGGHPVLWTARRVSARITSNTSLLMSTHQSYRDLPALAGICSMAEAAKPGLSVEECVRRLKRYHYAFKRLHQIFTARITAEPIYELKMAFSLHAHLCAEHATALRKRVGEMREPPLGLEAVPDPSLEVLFDEILSAPTTEELMLGLYEKAIPALNAALERHLRDTNLLADHPSVRLSRFALLELDDMLKFGAQSIAALVDDACRKRVADWLSLLDDCLAAAGGLDGCQTLPHKPHLETDGPLSPSLSPSEGERVPKAGEGSVHGFKAPIGSGNSLPKGEGEPCPARRQTKALCIG